MAEIYIKYNKANGFERAADKGALSGKVLAYADFKAVDHENGADGDYGIVLDTADVKDFIENYEHDAFFSAEEKA